MTGLKLTPSPVRQATPGALPELVVDGSQGEGGGQILRTSLALSMVTGRPVRFTRIRAGRPKPGLMRQHLTCVQAALAVCGGTVDGAALGSTELRFAPGPVQAGNWHFQVPGAGSCLLVLQTVLPALMQAPGPSRLRLGGGTHNPWAPPFDFVQRAYAPLLARLGVRVDLQLARRGFHPGGGGDLRAEIHPATAGLTPVDLAEPGPLQAGWAEALAPGLNRSIAKRELEAIGHQMGWAFESGQLRVAPSPDHEGPGNALLVVLQQEHVTEVFCSLGEHGVASEKVASRLAREVHAYQASGAALGEHLADQWMLPLALAVWQSGRPAHYTASQWSRHSSTNAQVIGQWLPVRVTHTQRGQGRSVGVTVERVEAGSDAA
jgi:RNA 3'-terminal phosphate cyclase (ATP)